MVWVAEQFLMGRLERTRSSVRWDCDPALRRGNFAGHFFGGKDQISDSVVLLGYGHNSLRRLDVLERQCLVSRVGKDQVSLMRIATLEQVDFRTSELCVGKHQISHVRLRVGGM
jgi:hypothetical protein